MTKLGGGLIRNRTSKKPRKPFSKLKPDCQFSSIELKTCLSYSVETEHEIDKIGLKT